jgi:hypothetical protein
MGIPKWVDCSKCINKDVLCMTCKVKYPTAPYLNYCTSYSVATDNTTK